MDVEQGTEEMLLPYRMKFIIFVYCTVTLQFDIGKMISPAGC